MLKDIKTEIDFLKNNNLETELWEETSMELVKRLTSDIKTDDKRQKSKLAAEVFDFLAKGKGNDDSFDFVVREDKKFFQEIHIYHYVKDGKQKVKARIDRTIIDEDGKHRPFENLLTIRYSAKESETGKIGSDILKVDYINVLGTKYVPFPTNLVFAEKMFANMAKNIVAGKTLKKGDYKKTENNILMDIPDIFATPEQKDRNKRLQNYYKYKIWNNKDGAKVKSDLKLKDTKGCGVFARSLQKAISNINIDEIDAEGLSEEEIFQNLVNNLKAKDHAQSERLKRQALEFFDHGVGNGSFNVSKKYENGRLVYEIENNSGSGSVTAKINYHERSSNKKYTNIAGIVKLMYEEDPEQPGSYECTAISMLGYTYPVTKTNEKLANKFYNFLLFELETPEDMPFDMGNLNEALEVLNDNYTDTYRISQETLEEAGVALTDEYEDQKEYNQRMEREKQIRMKKKYEKLYAAKLEYK